MNLDHELREALRRKDPPLGFERRVLSQLARGETLPALRRRSSWQRFALPLAASVALIAGATYVVHVREEQRAREQALAGERATIEVARALTIASEKVAAVQIKFQEFNQHDSSIQP